MVGRAVALGVLLAILCASLGSAEEAQLRKLLGGAKELKIQIEFKSPGSEGITDLDGQLYLNLPYRGYGTIRP